MEEIKRALVNIKKDSENALANNKKAMNDANVNGASQWYKNDLILQEMIAQTRLDFSNRMLEFIAELEQGQIKPVIKSAVETSSQGDIVEDEEDVLRRFKS